MEVCTLRTKINFRRVFTIRKDMNHATEYPEEVRKVHLGALKKSLKFLKAISKNMLSDHLHTYICTYVHN